MSAGFVIAPLAAAHDRQTFSCGAEPLDRYLRTQATQDVRRHIATMSATLEAARLVTYRSAWLSDTQGPTQETTAALYRAKYLVGEAVSSITRTALTLGGAHGIFKGSRLEQLFRDGALAEIQPPPTDFCLWNMGIHELGLDPEDILPPLKKS